MRALRGILGRDAVVLDETVPCVLQDPWGSWCAEPEYRGLATATARRVAGLGVRTINRAHLAVMDGTGRFWDEFRAHYGRDGYEALSRVTFSEDRETAYLYLCSHEASDAGTDRVHYFFDFKRVEGRWSMAGFISYFDEAGRIRTMHGYSRKNGCTSADIKELRPTP